MATVELQDGPLKDIQEILELKPDLNEEEVKLAVKMRPQLQAMLRPGVRTELEAEYSKRFADFQQTTIQQSREAVQNAIKEWKDDQKPLTGEEIGTLLSQDYIQFTTNFKIRKGKDMIDVHLNLVELPQEQEERFLKVLKTRFIPMMQGLVAAEFKLELDTSAVEKLSSLVQAMPAVLGVLSEIVAICLDPFGDIIEYGKIDEKWVKRNLSTHRILAIIVGQMEVQRYRDFFLNGFRLSKSLQKTR